MAHMIGGKGPYPDKAGEYCGNHLLGGFALALIGQTHEDAERDQAAYLSQMRFGRPRPCKAGTTEEMEAQGMVGLYLKASRHLYSNEIQVPTPPELMEPATAELE